MKFSYTGKWTNKAQATLSDKIRRAFENLFNKILNKEASDETTEPKLFGNVVIDSELNWELSSEMSLDEFKEIARSAREDDEHLLEWLREFGKSLIAGAKQCTEAAKELLPDIKALKNQDRNFDEDIRHEHALKSAQNMHDEQILREKLAREYADFLCNEKKTKKETARD